jgi:integrase
LTYLAYDSKGTKVSESLFHPTLKGWGYQAPELLSYAAIITLAWSCGLRSREVYLAKIGDINQIPPAHPHDPGGKYLLVNKSHLETGDHYIPIDPTAMRFLECWLGFHPFADNPKAYLFCSKDGKAINGANTQIDITSLRREAIKYGKHGSLTHAAHLSEQSYLREHRGEVIPESHWWNFPRMLPDLSKKVQEQLNHKTQQ